MRRWHLMIGKGLKWPISYLSLSSSTFKWLRPWTLMTEIDNVRSQPEYGEKKNKYEDTIPPILNENGVSYNPGSWEFSTLKVCFIYPCTTFVKVLRHLGVKNVWLISTSPWEKKLLIAYELYDINYDLAHSFSLTVRQYFALQPYIEWLKQFWRPVESCALFRRILVRGCDRITLTRYTKNAFESK